MFRLPTLLCLMACLVPPVTSTCKMTDEVCEFWLEISHKMTMMDYKTAVYGENGKLYHYDVTNTSAATPVDPDKVIVADGWETQRLVVVANGTMPGPTLQVYKNQQVIVHVKNKLASIATTIHWHGLHQTGTPWMDGVSFVTQCPILPEQSFTYKFKAYPSGTFWYHSHIGSQRSKGLLGALVILEPEPLPMPEHIMVLQDWNHDYDSDMTLAKMMYGNYEGRKKIATTGSLDGAHFSAFSFHSGLINGRGRYHFDDGSTMQGPLTVFPVTRGQSYRFRVIAAGSLFPFRVSVDDHKLTVVASDGYDLQPIEVESFIINPGERFDFVLVANQTVDNYWIRTETLEVNVLYHRGRAILRYDGAPDADPTTTNITCTDNNRCLVLNCPYTYYPTEAYTDCTHLGQLKSKTNYNTPGADSNNPEDIEEVFLNFAFPGITATPGSVNGRAFVHPPVSSMTQPQEISNACNSDICGEQKLCHCAYSLDLETNKTYQMVFLNMGIGKGWAHPIHMHGHSFYVLKIGYPTYNATTGAFLEENFDIDCRGGVPRDESFCNAAAWTNSSWAGNSVPGLELELPPRKDTLIVPTGGYVVIRLRADNPGLWFMHCHIELHNLDGMAMMFNESFSHQPAPPPGFPKCGSFDYNDSGPDTSPENPGNANSNNNNNNNNNNDLNDKYDTLLWVVVGCFIALGVLQVIIIGFLVTERLRTAKKYEMK